MQRPEVATQQVPDIVWSPAGVDVIASSTCFERYPFHLERTRRCAQMVSGLLGDGGWERPHAVVEETLAGVALGSNRAGHTLEGGHACLTCPRSIGEILAAAIGAPNWVVR